MSLQNLCRHVDLDVKQVEDISEFRCSLVEKRDIVDLGAESVSERGDKAMKVSVEDNKLAEYG